EIVGALPALAEDEGAGVDHSIEAAAPDGPHHGLAVDRDQDGRGLAHDDARRIVVHGKGDGLHRARRGERRLETVESGGPLRRGHLRLEGGDVSGAPVGQGGEVTASHLEVLEGHDARHSVHLRARGGPDDAEDLVLAMDGPHRHRRTEGQHVARPRLHLRLIDEEGGGGKLHLPWPWIRGHRGRRRQSGFLALSRRDAGEGNHERHENHIEYLDHDAAPLLPPRCRPWPGPHYGRKPPAWAKANPPAGAPTRSASCAIPASCTDQPFSGVRMFSYLSERCVTTCMRVGFSHRKNGLPSALALSTNLSALARISSSTVFMRSG